MLQCIQTVNSALLFFSKAVQATAKVFHIIPPCMAYLIAEQNSDQRVVLENKKSLTRESEY